MNSTHICPRCGWDCSEKPVTVNFEGWPDNIPTPPPLPPEAVQHHPIGVCPCPFEIGQKLYWDMDGADPDLPPLLVMFKKMAEIECAHYEFLDGDWVRRTEPKPRLAVVRAVASGTFECHKELFGEALERELTVTFNSLTPEDHWPIYEVA